MAYRISDRRLTPEEMECFTNANRYRGLVPTGELMESYSPETKVGICGVTRVVFVGRKTAYDTVRDCGDHYIIALHDRYDRIDKGTMKVTKDVEDW